MAERAPADFQEDVQISAIPSSSVTHTPRIFARWHPDLVAWAVGVLTATLYITYNIAQWNAFLVPSWDLGIFTELAQQYAHLNAPIVDIKGPGFNLLGDHFHPLLFVLGPLFRLFPSGLTLLILQSLLFGWSAVPITRYGRTKLGALWGTLAGVAYATSWGLTEAVSAQFHEIAFAVPLLAFGLVAWLEGHHRRGAILLGLLVFVKEDLGLTVAMFGLLLVWTAWGHTSARMEVEQSAQTAQPGSTRPGGAIVPFPLRSWKSLRRTIMEHSSTPGLAFITWGVFWFVAATMIILPLLNPHGTWDYTNNVGETEQTVGGMLGFFINLLGPGQKIVTVGLLIFALGVAGLASPLWWLMLPTLAWRFAGNVQYYWGWEWHYSAVLMPIATLALIDGVLRIKARPRLRESWRKKVSAAAVSIALVSSLAMFFTAGPMENLVRGQVTTSSARSEGARGALAAVGTGRIVVSDLTLLAYLVPGNTVYWSGSVGEAQVDTIVRSPDHSEDDLTLDSTVWAHEKYGGQWTEVYSEWGFEVLMKNGTF